HIHGCSKRIDAAVKFDCNESGSTLRFMVPIALAKNGGQNLFVGRGKLGTRPLDIYEKICKEQNISYINDSQNNVENLLDLKVKGQLRSGVFSVKGNVSSQFITGLMFALPTLDSDSEIAIEGELQSKGYLDLTLSALKDFGIEIVNENYKRFLIKGKQKYLPRNYRVEGDWSQATFYEVANYLGNNVDMQGLNVDSEQGDKVIVDFIKRLRESDCKETLVFDGGNCPDIIPAFALACCLRNGKTEIVNISRLRIKECDRLSATVAELKKLGANIQEKEDAMSIVGVDGLQGGDVETYNDHRMAMMLAIAATRANGKVRFSNYKCVSKSYPDFFEDYNSLGGKAQIINK
ncbi:MAG: 3-phosphoshikimate 1-carboxyvinyltransferase, partial [Clostridia bacterium]|nr:3-phosphoshikimate 1-carboxyvinyltransferase [Clostridia bacterium]